MRKRILSICLLVVTLLGGCQGYDEVAELKNISALSSESGTSNNYNLSYTDAQQMIYAQVSNRQLLDLSTLDKCTDSEIQQVVNYMNQVDEQLIGNISTQSYTDTLTKYFLSDMYNDSAVLDTCFTDYLLSFFARTPYYWQRTKTTIRGIDAESRNIVVDVQYKTIDFDKTVKPDSTIVKGEPNYEEKLRIRYDRWIDILDLKYGGGRLTTYEQDYNKFVDIYGDPSIIIDEQRVLSPTGEIYETGNQLTYIGLIDTDCELSHATMTVRYVLETKYVLGINLGITCKHMYITDYQLTNDCTEGLSTFTKEGYATVTDSVYNLIYSYFTCIDESDFNGLYKLSHNFERHDKYYNDYFTTAYRKHEGFSVSLFDITGTHIKCGVTISSKERALGAEMTFPIYTDRYYMELELVDDILKVENMVLLSRRLEGEPAITTDDADVSGFVASIDLDNDDRIAIEKLICDFSAAQLQGDIISDNFSDVVDISISQGQLTTLQENMMSLSGVRKVVWLQNYQQGTSNYASVKCKELYQDDSNTIVEASVIYDFIRKGGQWYIYNYKILSTVTLDTTNLSTTGSLCLVSPGKVEAYTSQIKSSQSTNLDDVSDTSVVFDHPEYMPVLKSGSSELGKTKFRVEDIDEGIFNSAVMSFSFSLNTDYNGYVEQLNNCSLILDELGNPEYSSLIEDYNKAVMEAIAFVHNVNNNRYTESEHKDAYDFVVGEINDVLNPLKLAISDVEPEYKSFLSRLMSWGNALTNQLGVYK